MAIQIGQISAPITANTTQFERSIRNVRKMGQRVGRNMQKVGSSMTRSLTLPLAAASAAIFKVGSDFESEMSKIQGLVGVSQEQVKEWSKEIRDLSSSVGRGPTELAEGMFFVTSAGFRGAEAMEVLEMSAKAASAGLGETKQVADLVTSAINAYGSENLNASQATDVLTAAVREGKLEAESLAPVMGRLLPLASELGVQFDEVSGFMAAMSKTGLGANEASTALRSTLATLTKPTSDARETLQQYGTSIEELRNIAGKQGLLPVLNMLRDRFGDNKEALSNVFPNVRALTGVLNILGQDADSVASIMEGTANSTGDLDKAFQAASETGQFSLNQMLAELSSLAGEVYDSMIGLLKPAFDTIRNAISGLRKSWDNLSPQIKRNSIVVAGLVAAIGPAITIIGTLTTVVSALISPVGATVAAVAALGGVALYVVKNWDAFADSISRLATIMMNSIVEFVASSIESLDSLLSYIPGVDSVFGDTADSVRAFKSEIPSAEDAASFQGFGEFIGSVGSDINGIITGISDSFLSLPKAAKSASEGVKQSGLDQIGRQEVSAGFSMETEGLEMASGSLQKVPEMASASQVALRGLREEFGAVSDDLANNIAPMIGQSVANMAADFASGIGKMAVAGGGLKGVFKGVLSTLAGLAISVGKTAIATGIAVKGIKEALKSLNPIAAIAAGAALIAVGAAAKAALSGAADKKGGQFHDGGIVPGGQGGSRLVRAKGGEGIFTPGQMAAMGDMAGGGGVNPNQMERAFSRALGRYASRLGPEEVFALSQKGQFSY